METRDQQKNTQPKPLQPMKKDDSKKIVRPGKSCLKKTTTPANGADKPKRAVDFKDVTVLEFPMIMGDNPAVSKGPPLQIDWVPQFWDSALDIDSYEKCRKYERRHRKKLVISSQQRVVLLISSGYDLEDIAERTLEMHKLKELRAESLKAQGLGGAFWDVLSGSAEATGRALRKLDVVGDVAYGTGEVVGLTARILGQVTYGTSKEIVKGTGKIVMGTGKVVTDVAKGTGYVTGMVVTGTGKAVLTGATEVGKGTGKVVKGTGRVVTDVLTVTGKGLVVGTREVVRGTGKVLGAIGRPLTRLSSYDDGQAKLAPHGGFGSYDQHSTLGSRALSSASASVLGYESDDYDTHQFRTEERRLSRGSNMSRSSSTGDLEEKAKEKEHVKQHLKHQQQVLENSNAVVNKFDRARHSGCISPERVRAVAEGDALNRPMYNTNSRKGNPQAQAAMLAKAQGHDMPPPGVQRRRNSAQDPVMDELRGMEDFLMALQGMDKDTLKIIMEQEKQQADKNSKKKPNLKKYSSSNKMGEIKTI